MLPFQISPAQLEALDRASDERFVELLLDLFDVDPSEPARTPVRPLYRARLQAARRLGLSTEYEVGAFVECCEAYGDGFPSASDHPACRILSDYSLSSEARADALLDLVHGASDAERDAPLQPDEE